MSRSSPPYRFRFPRITTTTFQSSVNSYRQGALVVAPERSQLNSSNRSISMRRKNRLIGVLSEIKKIRMKSTNLYFWLGVVCMSVFQFMLGSAITGLNPLAASSSSTVGDGPYGQFHRKASAQLSGEQQPREVLSVRKKGSNLQIGLSKLVRKQADRTKESIFLNGEADLVDPILESIVKEGMFYSLGRKDRSGSVVSDMLFAHAFAWAHNVTYAGACYTTKGLPKKDTRHLLEQLRWDHILPFQCPTGVGPHLDDSNPNATELSPLILDRQVYRDNIPTSHFTKLWRESLQDSIARVSSSVALAPDRPFDIAVHVRRGDVTPCRYKRRYLTNEHYLKLIDKYTPGHSELDGRRVHVTIYSETDSFEPFEVFRDRGYTLELDTQDLSSVWKALTTADVVILSRSYFSFVPAAVNPNVVVATHFFEFEPLDGWKRAEESLVKDTDKKIRQIFNSQCNATAIELERMKVKAEDVGEGELLYRINTGSFEFDAPNGDVWAENEFSTGGSNFTLLDTSTAITGTENDELYQSEQNGMSFSYSIPIPDGTESLQVILHMAEIFHTSADQRIFNVMIEDDLVLEDLDLFSDIGEAFHAKQYVFPIEVTDGTLDISFDASIDQAKVSGIEVFNTEAPATTSSPAISPVSAAPIPGTASPTKSPVTPAPFAGTSNPTVTPATPAPIAGTSTPVQQATSSAPIASATSAPTPAPTPSPTNSPTGGVGVSAKSTKSASGSKSGTTSSGKGKAKDSSSGKASGKSSSGKGSTVSGTSKASTSKGSKSVSSGSSKASGKGSTSVASGSGKTSGKGSTSVTSGSSKGSGKGSTERKRRK